MRIYHAKTPEDYERYFYRQAGMYMVKDEEQERVWENGAGGFIRIWGAREKIQFGYAGYTIPDDFLVGYQYDIEYLHFGIIYEGTAYSLVENNLKAREAPAVFLAVEKARGGVNCWKEGQRFKGMEVSVEMTYLREVMLPVLGLAKDALSFLQENVRYTRLPEGMRTLIWRAEKLLLSGQLTGPLQTSICLEFISLLLHPENRRVFNLGEIVFAKYVPVGGRKIKITSGDFEKIVMAHDRIGQDATSFFTTYELSRELGISEQKLKAGFKELYRQTLWDYANNVRMRMAAGLLKNTELGIGEIARRTGYQSQAAFTSRFKKWCNVTPGQFRIQNISCDDAPPE